ncbi:unnamed protein product [Cyberlindnera jadinii]|uniref:CTP-dependent diacylglycerol kinase 1 n=1 Tax=Cyberlindnera jadinii (strain ATCC 18201 / CBS 1600 / BCRC 20928 / JCM 3617 / NBRC 0987 / NRRL Y-1542) TaxID=983966 RepID=A0A0H5C269_CYBJN|nr:unnamed protein product [Cyberlindnera jadinii]
MSTSALPSQSTRRRVAERGANEKTVEESGLAAPSTSSSSRSDDALFDTAEGDKSVPTSADSLAVPVANDYVGPLVKRPNSPSLGNDFLTAHHVFGDYIRKHEIPRKVFHSSIGFITLYLWTQGVQINLFPKYFHVAFIVITLLDLIRFYSKTFNYMYCQVVGFLMREKEVHGFNGVIWYILGLDFAFSFTTKDIAVLSVLLLSWSDTAASTCGRAWGHLTPKIARNKSLAGSMAAFAIGVISSYILYGYIVPTYSQFNAPGSILWTPEISYLNIHTMSILAGFIAALSEGIDLFNWDDNFTIPVLSSIFFYIVIYIFRK